MRLLLCFSIHATDSCTSRKQLLCKHASVIDADYSRDNSKSLLLKICGNNPSVFKYKIAVVLLGHELVENISVMFYIMTMYQLSKISTSSLLSKAKEGSKPSFV
jgi:hypothetical protein